MVRSLYVLLVYLLVAVHSGNAADIYVNNVTGNDGWDGSAKTAGMGSRGPLKSIAKAMARVRAGDIIHLEPGEVPYAEEMVFRNKGGEPGRPITVDGHGATLDGSDPCVAGAWKKVTGSLWRQEGAFSRNSLIVDDRIVLERKASADLQPGQFCFESTQFIRDLLLFKPPEGKKANECVVKVVWSDGEEVTLDPQKWEGRSVVRYKLARPGSPERVLLDGGEAPFLRAKDLLKPGEWCMDGKDLYFCPPTGKEPSALNVRRVVRGTGVSLAGEMGHFVIRNLNVRFVWNDAFNVHGEVVDASFFNCNARDCFDEGFSAHDRCETVLDGAVFERCDNGVFNVNEGGWSVTCNLTVRESRHYGFGVAILESKAKHWLSDAMLEDNPVSLFGRYLEADNVKVVSSIPTVLNLAGPLVLDHTTVMGESVTLTISQGSGPLRISRSMFSARGRQEIVFEKPAEVELASVRWSPQTEVMLKPQAKSISLGEWIGGLGGAARESGEMAAGD